MTEMQIRHDLQPWEPVPCQLPASWIALTDTLSEQIKGSLRHYVLGMKYQANSVGQLLYKWGLPWDVVIAGQLWEYGEDQNPIRQAQLEENETALVLKHMEQAKLYSQYIEHDVLPPLLTPPYSDLGALLLAVAIYYETLHVLSDRSSRQPFQGQRLSEIENVGNTLLNITKRLGMWDAKRQIEDRIEQLRNPRQFTQDQQEHARILARDANHLNDVCHLLANFYQEITGKPIEIVYNPCGIAGLRRRQQDAHTTATTQKTQLTGFDLATFDVIVPTVQDCYIAFGVLSQLGRIQDRVTDLIANPKPNGCSNIALGIVLNPNVLHASGLNWLEASSLVCQLQIATHTMQAIMHYGCLYPDCYQLYTSASQKEQKLSLNAQYWESEAGRLFQAIENGFRADQTSSDQDAPIIIYGKERNAIRLPKGATALDFAFALDSSIGERAVEAFINNRKAPLNRVLDAGDIIEIRTSRDIQTQHYWVEESYAKTTLAQKYIRESLSKISLNRKSYRLLRQKLEQQDYFLSPEELRQELLQLVSRRNLGTLEEYLEQLEEEGKAPNTPEWAAEQIIRQIEERREPLLVGTERVSWIAVVDRSLVTTANTLHRQRLCHSCRPRYPRDTEILGLRKPNGEIVVHKQNCPYLLGRNSQRSELLPMTWQQRLPSFRVAFFVLAQDRTGLIHDLTRQLRRHDCELLSIYAETLLKFKEAYIRFVIEAYEDEEVLNIRQQISSLEGVTKAEINAVDTSQLIYDRLQKLREQKTSVPIIDTVSTGSLWEEIISTLQPRSPRLKNPYDISRPASGRMFFGRTQEMQTLQRELCASERGKAIILSGPRRSGKSSLCKNFLYLHVLPPACGVLFSLQNAVQQTEETILKQLSEKIFLSFEEHLQQKVPSWNDYNDTDPEVRFRRIVHACIDNVPDTRLVLALDEFGGVLESYERGILEPRFFTFWKELMADFPQLSLLLALPTSSHYTLLKHFANVFSFATPLRMAFLDRESAEHLLTDPLRDQQVAVHPNTLARAVTLTGGNPYFMTLIGYLLVDYLNQDPSKQIVTVEDLDSVINSLLVESNSNVNFDFLRLELQNNEELRLLEGLVELTRQSDQPQVSLKKIAAQANFPVSLARQHLARLHSGLILQQSGSSTQPHYSFTIELIRLWLSRNSWFFLPSITMK